MARTKSTARKSAIPTEGEEEAARLKEVALEEFAKRTAELPKANAQTMRAVLTMDDFCRRRRTWKLLGPEEFCERLERHSVPNVRIADGNNYNRRMEQRGLPAPAEDLFCTFFHSHWRSNMTAFGHAQVTSEGVREVLKSWFPALEALFAKAGPHLLAAGGAVMNAMRCASEERDTVKQNFLRFANGDLDLFLVGIKESEARAFLEKLFADTFDNEEKANLSRGPNVITVRVDTGNYRGPLVYQFILRLYDSPDLVLGGFDLPCCAVGYNPDLGLVMTELAAWSLSTGLLPVDTSRRSPSYEYRISKYAYRGIRFVFPSFRPPKADDDAWKGGLMFGKLKLTRQQSGEAQIRSSPQQGAVLWGDGTDETPSDYDSEEHPSVFAYSNIIKAASGSKDRLSAVLLVAGNLPALIDNPTVPGRIGLDKTFRSRANRNYWSANLPILEMYQNWFGQDAPEFVVAKMANDRARMDEVVERTVARIGKALDDAASEYNRPLVFITQDPGRQYTGSFNPIHEHAREWYPKEEELYRPTFVGMPSPELVWLVKQILAQYGFPKDLVRMILGSYCIPAIALFTLEEQGYLY